MATPQLRRKFKNIEKKSIQDSENNPIIESDGFYHYKNKEISFGILTPADLKQFKVDKKYMREMSNSHVSDISYNFTKVYKDDHFCAYTYPVAISVRDNGKRVIIDGQHRIASAILTGKSIFAIFYYGLSIDDEINVYVLNNNIKAQSSNHRMDLLARIDLNVGKIYNILDNILVGWDTDQPSVSRLNFVGAISLIFKKTFINDVKKIPLFLESLTPDVYLYFNQVISILDKAYPYKPEYGMNRKKKESRFSAECYWERAELYLACFKFVVYYHIRFGNNIKNDEKIVEYLKSIASWEALYMRSRENGGQKLAFIMRELVDVYNGKKRKFSNMLPIYHSKIIDKGQFPYLDDFLIPQKMEAKETTKVLIESRKKKIKEKAT